MNFAPIIQRFFIIMLILSGFSGVAYSVHDNQTLAAYMTPHDQIIYSTITHELEQLQKTINHNKIAELTKELEEHKESQASQEEIEKVEEQLDQALRVFLTSHGQPTNAANVAPTISTMLNTMFTEITRKSNVQKMPDIALHLTNGALNNDALSATAVLYSHHKFIDIGEEFFKTFFWNKQALEMLPAIFAHEFCHIKFEHSSSSIQNEYDADAFAVTILDEPKVLFKAIDLVLLSNILNHALSCHTNHSFENTAKISRVIANYITDTVPHLGSLGKATTNAALSMVIVDLVAQANNRAQTSDELLNNLGIDITLACKNNDALTAAYEKALAYEDQDTHPGPLPRRCNIKHCIFAKSNL